MVQPEPGQGTPAGDAHSLNSFPAMFFAYQIVNGRASRSSRSGKRIAIRRYQIHRGNFVCCELVCVKKSSSIQGSEEISPMSISMGIIWPICQPVIKGATGFVRGASCV